MQNDPLGAFCIIYDLHYVDRMVSNTDLLSFLMITLIRVNMNNLLKNAICPGHLVEALQIYEKFAYNLELEYNILV